MSENQAADMPPAGGSHALAPGAGGGVTGPAAAPGAGGGGGGGAPNRIRPILQFHLLWRYLHRRLPRLLSLMTMIPVILLPALKRCAI